MWAISPELRRLGDLLTRADVYHLHESRDEVEQRGAELGGKHRWSGDIGARVRGGVVAVGCGRREAASCITSTIAGRSRGPVGFNSSVLGLSRRRSWAREHRHSTFDEVDSRSRRVRFEADQIPARR